MVVCCGHHYDATDDPCTLIFHMTSTRMMLTFPPHVHANILAATCSANIMHETIYRNAGLVDRLMKSCGITFHSLQRYGCTAMENVSCQVLRPLILWFGMRGGMTRSHHWVRCIANECIWCNKLHISKGCGHESSWGKIRVTLTCLAQLRLEN